MTDREREWCREKKRKACGVCMYSRELPEDKIPEAGKISGVIWCSYENARERYRPHRVSEWDAGCFKYEPEWEGAGEQVCMFDMV